MPQDDDKKVWMTQEERDLQALQRQRDARVPLEHGDEITMPTNVHALERYHNDPAYRELWDYAHAWKHAAQHGLHVIGDAALAAHAAPAAELEERVRKLEDQGHHDAATLRLVKWVGSTVAVICLTSALVVAGKIFSWGVSTGETEVRLNRLEHDVQQLFDRQQSHPMWPAAQPPKGATP